MTVRRPSKPWRVILTGPIDRDGATIRVETEHTSERHAYDYLRTELGLAKQGERPHIEAKVMQWENGRWIWFDNWTKEDMP